MDTYSIWDKKDNDYPPEKLARTDNSPALIIFNFAEIMETKEPNKQEYQLRINKVTDYICKNIDQPLPLRKMAGIACFSPFHFHRVFTILTGETPTDYIKRTRIEKAALLLKQDKELSATEVARLCGFSSLSLLSRNFRQYFSMTIREFRSQQ